MNSHKSWTNTQQQQTLMHSFISTVTSTGLEDISNLAQSLSHIDKRLSKMYAPQGYDPQLIFNQSIVNPSLSMQKLSIPKGNTLTDALIRNTLGCDQKYAKQYMQLLGSTEQKFEKDKRIDQIKKQFTQSNTFIDVSANSKPFIPKPIHQNPRPVVDNQHQAYLKTQLIFLEKPNNSKINHKQYYEKHYDTITQQIEQIGGIQDTLSRMEATLKNNEISNVKNRSILKELPSSTKNPFSQTQHLANPPSQIKSDNNWLQKSKQLRHNFVNKYNK